MADSAEKRLEDYILGVPKAELHVHIEGTLEPELVYELAARNGIPLEGDVETLKRRRENFQNLQDFLDMYYEACAVLLTEQDFYDLMYEYLRRATIDNVYVAEIFFDPQTHTERGVKFDTVINGLHRALIDGYLNFGIKGSLIMCFLRHMTEDSAIETLQQATPHLDKLLAVGLDSGEVGNPPSKFERVFKMASVLGLKRVAHAGEEAGPAYITQALDLLHVRRVDHGVRCVEDEAVLKRLVDQKIPLTTCPLSNQKLKVNARFLGGRNITKDLLQKGTVVTVNSDDPAYFGGYITENFLVTAREVGLTEKDVCQICRNSFTATFLPETEKRYYLRKIDQFNITMGHAPPPKSVTFFGSRSSLPGSDRYEDCFKVAELFASHGFSIVNGGYNGLMEAASKGGAEGMKISRTPNVEVVEVKGVLAPRVFSGRHSTGNPFLTRILMSRTINERIGRLVDASEYVFVSGGTIGTLTELLVAWNEASVRPMHGGATKKLYLLKSFWEETVSHLTAAVGIFPEDCKLLTFVDSAQEVVRLVKEDWE